MNALRRLWILLLAGLIILLAGASPAAGQGGGHLIYLPVVMTQGGTGSPDTLVNGGKVQGPDGVGIGALANTLDAPVQVSITTLSAPSTAIPAPAQAIGNYYQISARESVLVSPQSPFILAFPTPAGANTEHLALAVLQTGEHATDVDESLEAWYFQEGKLDPGGGLFLTTIAGLEKTGTIFTVVEHPGFDSPSSGAPARAPHSNGSRSPQFDLFTVRCLGFTNPDDCTANTEGVVASTLTNAHNYIQQSLGFDAPRLRYMDETLAYNPLSYSSLGYSTYIEPYDSGWCVGNGGHYQPATGRLVFCYDPAVGFTVDNLQSIVHEYFHATQYGYLETLADYLDQSREKWVIEGMAASAMKSYSEAEMTWTDYYGGLHMVDVSLEFSGGPDDDEYKAQDFWVYHGQHNGLNLSYLASVLQAGATSQAVVDVLGDGSVLDPYWQWVKNQVMEAGVDFDGALGTPCELETQVVSELKYFDFFAGSNTSYSVVLDPLTSVVVKINWDQAYHFAISEVGLGVGELPEAGLALRYKTYVNGEPNCATVPDRGRFLEDIDPAEDIYVVVSNIDPDNTYTYRLRILEYSPKTGS